MTGTGLGSALLFFFICFPVQITVVLYVVIISWNEGSQIFTCRKVVGNAVLYYVRGAYS